MVDPAEAAALLRSRGVHDLLADSLHVMVVQATVAAELATSAPDDAGVAVGLVQDTGRDALQRLGRLQRSTRAAGAPSPWWTSRSATPGPRRTRPRTRPRAQCRTRRRRYRAGHGLIGVHERVLAFGGILDAGPTADGGFRLSAWMPIPHMAGGGAS